MIKTWSLLDVAYESFRKGFIEFNEKIKKRIFGYQGIAYSLGETVLSTLSYSFYLMGFWSNGVVQNVLILIGIDVLK